MYFTLKDHLRMFHNSMYLSELCFETNIFTFASTSSAQAITSGLSLFVKVQNWLP